MRLLFLPTIALLLAIALLVAVAPPAAAATGTPGLFGTIEVQRSSQKPFPKWTGPLARIFEERNLLNRPCDGVRGGRIDPC